MDVTSVNNTPARNTATSANKAEETPPAKEPATATPATDTVELGSGEAAVSSGVKSPTDTYASIQAGGAGGGGKPPKK
ncbi:hypothetical protein [Ferrimonas kyonanensis]|uniref:hypothetical protein n=1 Tax=Ferrimonas kyonanensis TaxID=364763 RepID=UPI00040A9143|nr:hypothetical protein [Ferrimonas kyonanensis]